MFYSARSQAAVDCLIAPFRVDATSEAVASMLFSCSRDEIMACMEYARANGVLSLFAAQIEKLCGLSCLPRDLHTELTRTLEEGQQRSREQLEDTVEVALALQDRDIPYMVLKGAPFVYLLYSGIGVRSSRDLDLLIDPDHIGNAHEVLKHLGFAAIPGKYEADHHLPRMIRSRAGGTQFGIDPHHRLVPPLVYGIRVNEIEGLWERGIWIDVGGGHKLRTLSHSDHVLHMHVHLFHHLFYNFRIMHLMDVVFAARFWRTLVDWTKIADQLEIMGLERFQRDLWLWIATYFGDVLPCDGASISEEIMRVGAWLLRHGSLPIFAGLRYAKSYQERIHNLGSECHRFMYRSLWAPRWGLLYSGSSTL